MTVEYSDTAGNAQTAASQATKAISNESTSRRSAR